jgi:hypothetical protein
MTRKVVRHSIIAALAFITACSALPSPLITSPGLASADTLSGSAVLDIGSYTTDLFSNPADPFGINQSLTESDLGLNTLIDPIPVRDFGDSTTALLDDPISALLSGDIAGGGGRGERGRRGEALDSLMPPTQVVPSQRVHLASETEVTPTTSIFPNLTFQPSIRLYDPLINDFQTYGVGPEYTNEYLGDSGGFDVAPFKKRQIAGGLAGGAFGPSPIGGGDVSSPMGSPPFIVNGIPTDVTTDTLIQPIVNIQPHTLQPVPIPVSAPYNYPVPIGVSVPVGSIEPVGFPGGWGSNDYDWGKWGGGWHGSRDCDDDWNWGEGWRGGWDDDYDWGWDNDYNW